jgi:Acetyltransferase (GNAT) domain
MGLGNLGRGDTGVSVTKFTEADKDQWDSFLTRSAQGCFIHSRRFLGYHGERFKDCSLIARDKNGKIQAVFPAAENPHQGREVISHPGLTHGGLIHDPALRPEAACDVLCQVLESLTDLGYTSLVVKPVPDHLFRVQTQIEKWLYWRTGATVTRADLWNVIDLRGELHQSKGQKWSSRKAMKNHVELRSGTEADMACFHEMLCDALAERHRTRPVHSRDELLALWGLFPDKIALQLAESRGRICAGVLLFDFSPVTIHSQYIASTESGRADCALNLLLEDYITRAKASGYPTFSFGASTEAAGLSLNSGLFGFKAGFGLGSVTAFQWRLDLGLSLQALKEARL